MTFLNSNRVLCLSPHPDDVEYSMSGTILKNKNTIFDILCLSSGGNYDITTSSSRNDENINFWKGVDNINLLLDNRIIDFSEDKAISTLENNYDLSKYDTIFIPPKNDTHFFHRSVNKLGKSLCRVSLFNLYEYYTPSTESDWVPNLVVDISEHYDDKKNRLKKFKSQQKHAYFSDFCLNSFHTDLIYNKKGLGWVEKYKTILSIL